ncbi:hypothetical protein E6R62_38975 [Streptomyces sp. A1136]|nr:hypothetical protein E6R62_38975 [Streptomyces sp. A1136]
MQMRVESKIEESENQEIGESGYGSRPCAAEALPNAHSNEKSATTGSLQAGFVDGLTTVARVAVCFLKVKLAQTWCYPSYWCNLPATSGGVAHGLHF